MGIIINEWDYGFDCPLYFGPGKTPKFLMCSFTGIETGDRWTDPPDPPCPNGIFLLTQIPEDPCVWILWNATYIITYKISPIRTQLFCAFQAGLPEIFIRNIPGQGKFFFTNELDNPIFNEFVGGSAQIAWVAPSPSPSLRDAVEKMGYDPDGPIKVDFWPVDEDYMLVRVVNEEDHTSYYAKYKFT